MTSSLTSRQRIHLLAAIGAVSIALLASAATAHATVFPSSSTLMRGTAAVGTVSGTVVLAPTGFAIAGVRVDGFQAPAAKASWRIRTVVKGECLDVGFDPSKDDRDTFHVTPFTTVGNWSTRRFQGATGALAAVDQVHECAAGQETGGSFVANVMVKNLAATRIVGTSTLFAAG